MDLSVFDFGEIDCSYICFFCNDFLSERKLLTLLFYAFAVARSYSGLTKFFRCDQIIIHCGPATTALDFAREKGYRVEEWSRVSDETTQSQYNSFLASRMAADINLPDYCDIHAEDFPVEKNDEDADESEFDEVADEGVDPFDYTFASSS